MWRPATAALAVFMTGAMLPAAAELAAAATASTWEGGWSLNAHLESASLALDVVASAAAARPGEAEVPSADEEAALASSDCQGSSTGFPICGVQYVPHLVGEPYPDPSTDIEDVYAQAYQGLHKRDLPLIAQGLGADTLRLRPWSVSTVQHTVQDRSSFFAVAKGAGLSKMVPTFQLSRHYAEALKHGGLLRPDLASGAYLQQSFERFVQSVDEVQSSGLELVAWSIDLTLDLAQLPELAAQGTSTCLEPDQTTYVGYKSLLEGVLRLVRQPEYQALHDVPLLLPLDLSRMDWTRKDAAEDLQWLVQCMNTWAGGGAGSTWDQPLFGPKLPNRWLWSFSLPLIPDPYQGTKHKYRDFVSLHFAYRLHLLTDASPSVSAVVMVGANAVMRDLTPPNPIVEDYGSGNDDKQPDQQHVLAEAFKQYRAVRAQRLRQAAREGGAAAASGTLDGFIVDEWMDDWDRGRQGPFKLTATKIEGMVVPCSGRYTHDIMQCGAAANGSFVYPEFLGLAGSTSRGLQHCVLPRFQSALFPSGESGIVSSMECALMEPSRPWMVVAAVLLVAVVALHSVKRWFVKPVRANLSMSSAMITYDPEPELVISTGDALLVQALIEPTNAALCGGHSMQVRSTRFRTEEEGRWWLQAHVAAQSRILVQQVDAELAAMRAQKCRVGQGPEEEAVDEFAAPMEHVHSRCLEGFASWCLYVGGERKKVAKLVTNNMGRPPPLLFAEALALRVMESLGEHIINCPERLAFLYHKVLTSAAPNGSGNEDFRFRVDLEVLHQGLDQMMHNSNPYVLKQVPGENRRELGLNFDDINECGIQCRDRVVKTFKEPPSLMVLIDFVICYRSVILVKLWAFGIAFYAYLGSGLGRDTTTSFNGSLLAPQWLRLDFIQYAALVDAVVWLLLELVQLVYRSWQQAASIGWRSPGSPRCHWFVGRLLGIALAGGGLFVVKTMGSYSPDRPRDCTFSDTGPCQDPRQLLDIKWALLYWAVRLVLFIAVHMRRGPIQIPGRSDNMAWRKRFKCCQSRSGFLVLLVWLGILAACIFFELRYVLPMTAGLDWQSQCGLAFMKNTVDLPGLPQQMGPCTRFWLTSSCAPCALSVTIVWSLVIVSVLLDFYFAFYGFAAVGGLVMGHFRHLGDLKNKSRPVDLRERGRQARLFDKTFGPGWQKVWAMMVRGLLDESLLSTQMAASLAEAAGVDLDGEPQEGARRAMVDLRTLPGLAAERLAFFFKSLHWIETPHAQGPAGPVHDPAADALTAIGFHPGSIPSLTQIIPAHDEVVIPSSAYLRTGSLREHARNQNSSVEVGERTRPPLGDGMNSNLAFIISQHPREWVFLAERLGHQPHELYGDFIDGGHIDEATEVEIRLWAAFRTQSVAKTVVGALQYQLALASLPGIQHYYEECRPGLRVPEEHAELILAHQNYGHSNGLRENESAVDLLLQRYQHLAFYLVFDVTTESRSDIKEKVLAFIRSQGYEWDLSTTRYASCKCRWAEDGLEVIEVLPRMYPLRVGSKGCMTQGKASNQLNGLRFASGHYVQAMDCNMGAFIGEGFKVPYVLRTFVPLDAPNRRTVRSRYIGFREYIFTSRMGTVGKCHASAEWTFGTIYQRFLSGMAVRMHYGHPDFVDGFWARNRGGMSKCSPVVNLSEDIFAGYNVRMRGEASPHIDFLEFEKGREATFNAASNFFSKIAGGSIAVLRSRDNHLICERIGLLHGLSFYFSSIAFYASNFLVDISIYMYVALFLAFTLSSIELAQLTGLGAVLGVEWLISMGIVSAFPQFFELLLEYGPVRAFRDTVGSLLSSTLFFVFQNKNVASAMRVGAATGMAKYYFTGRPMANQHQSWKDLYLLYWKSHYHPAFDVILMYACYAMLSTTGRLPMILVVISFGAWLITPIIFSPFPRWVLLKQDFSDFQAFIVGNAGFSPNEIRSVIVRGEKALCRNIYESGLADELSTWGERPIFVLIIFTAIRWLVALCMMLALPAEMLDFMTLFFVFLGFNWVLVLGLFVTGLRNVFLVLSILMWAAVPLCGSWVIGGRVTSPSIGARLPELLVGFLTFIYMLGLLKRTLLMFCRLLGAFRERCCRVDSEIVKTWFQKVVRLSHFYFFGHQLNMMRAYAVLLINAVVTLVLIILDSRCFCNSGLHTWWLLNGAVAKRRRPGEGPQRVSAMLEIEATAW